jgi:PAS domain-containing protein
MQSPSRHRLKSTGGNQSRFDRTSVRTLSTCLSIGNLNSPAKFARVALNNLFEISPDAIFVIDAGGIIRDANPKAEERFGYTHEELIGIKVEELIPERLREPHPSHR